DSDQFREFLAPLPQLAELSSWRFAFWTAGLMGVVWCIAFFPWFRDDPAQVPAVNAAELRLIREGDGQGQGQGGSQLPGHHMPGAAWKSLFLCRSLWAIGCLYICGSFGWSFFLSWLPRYLKDVHHVEFKQSELMSGLPLFFGGISCLVGGTLSDLLVRRFQRKWLGRAVFPLCGFGTAALAMLCVPFVDDVNMVVVLLCLASAGNDFGQGANWASIVDIGGRYAGTATGFINMVGNAGNYMGPVIGAFIFNKF